MAMNEYAFWGVPSLPYFTLLWPCIWPLRPWGWWWGPFFFHQLWLLPEAIVAGWKKRGRVVVALWKKKKVRTFVRLYFRSFSNVYCTFVFSNLKWKLNSENCFLLLFTHMIEVEMSVCSKPFLSKKYHRTDAKTNPWERKVFSSMFQVLSLVIVWLF